MGIGGRKNECKLRKEVHRYGSERKGQRDEEKSLGRYVEDDWKQMLAAVGEEAERRDEDSEGYVSFKVRETEIEWPSLCRGKDWKHISYPFLNKKKSRSQT